MLIVKRQFKENLFALDDGELIGILVYVGALSTKVDRKGVRPSQCERRKTHGGNCSANTRLRNAMVTNASANKYSRPCGMDDHHGTLVLKLLGSGIDRPGSSFGTPTPRMQSSSPLNAKNRCVTRRCWDVCNW